jgi:pilus assembly protein CpaC
MAFSTKSFTEEEQELVVLVTPHLVDAMDCRQAPKTLPSEETRSADDFELFLEGILEAPRGPREVFPLGHYVPAYKSGPTAAQFPCAPGGKCGAQCAGKCLGRRWGTKGCQGGSTMGCDEGGCQPMPPEGVTAPAVTTLQNDNKTQQQAPVPTPEQVSQGDAATQAAPETTPSAVPAALPDTASAAADKGRQP